MLTPGELSALRLSAIVGVGAVVVALPPAVLAARWLSRATFRGKVLVEAAMLLPLVLPPVVTGLFLLRLLGRRGPLGPALEAMGLDVAFTWRGAVAAGAVAAFPLAYRACRVAFDAVDPALVGIARTLGASRWDAFRSVTLPLARGGVAAAAVLAFVRSVGEFGATIVLAGNVEGETRTLPLLVYTAIQTGGPRAEATVLRLSLVCVLLALAALVAIEATGRKARAA